MKRTIRILRKGVGLYLEFILSEFPNIIQILSGFLLFGVIFKLGGSYQDGKIILGEEAIQNYSNVLEKYVLYSCYIIFFYLLGRFIYFALDKGRETIKDIESKSEMIIVIITSQILLILTCLAIFLGIINFLMPMIMETEILRLKSLMPNT